MYGFMIMVLYFWYSMILFLILMRMRKEYVMVTYHWHYQFGHFCESKINKQYKEEFFVCMILNHIELVNLVSWIKWPRSHLLDMRKGKQGIRSWIYRCLKTNNILTQRWTLHIWMVWFSNMLHKFWFSFWRYTLEIAAYVLN